MKQKATNPPQSKPEKRISDDENFSAERTKRSFGISEISDISARLAANRWTWRLAKLGYAAKGLLYLIVGSTALLAAIKIGGRVRGTRGALNLLVAQPFGRIAVALVVVGLCGFVLRRFVQIFVSPNVGAPPKKIMRISRRAGFALSGLANIALALVALQLVFGLNRSNSAAAPTTPFGWQARLMAWNPLDGWLIFAVGLVVIGIAIFHFYMAATRRFSIDLQIERMSERMKKTVLAFGSAGYAGRGIGFLVIGAFLAYAGWFAEKIEPRTTGETLAALETEPLSWWLLIVIAAGFAAYGLYLLLAARYLRLIAAW